ncbi:MAG TPA: electron transfer flavoprotein subunit alpha/FixB family protein [Actinomycetota bacterium]
MTDVYVIVEQQEKQIQPVTFELLGKAAEIAPALGGQVVAVLVGGAGVADQASQLGAAARVLAISDDRLASYTPEAYKAVLIEALKDRDPRLILVGNTTIGMDLAAGLSIGLDLPLVAYAHDLAVDGSEVVATARVYGGKIDAEVGLEGPGVVSVQAGAFPAEAGQAAGSPEVEEIGSPPALDGVRSTFLALQHPEGGDVDITSQEVLVSVGRGIQSEDNLETMQELADALGGALSASRPITDSGWLPKTRQVGKSGLKVKPKLYLCAGISGAPEHLEGMRDAETIIAINTDENAPIFEVAHYGVVGDLFDIVPELTEKLKG